MVRKPTEPELPPPATTLEGREDQLITAAMNLAERRIHDGSASAQEVVHFLRLGSVRNQIEQKKLEIESRMVEARADEMASRASSEGLYKEALAAFRGYSGQTEVDFDDGDYDA